MKITRLKVTSYRGIAALDQEFTDAGAVIRGGNARGKTSVLKSIRAALAAQDIGPDAIRNGADSAEILVSMDDLTVRRAITKRGSSLTITNAAGDKKAKPQAFLTELIGGSAIDPLELLLAKPKDRRAQIIAAIPVTVTPEQLRQWAPLDIDCAGHGLEVIERARKIVYDRRTEANATAKAATAEAERLAAEAKTLAANAVDAPSVVDANAALERARQRFADLRSQERQAVEAEARQEASRARISDLRAQAADIASRVGDDPSADVASAEAAENAACNVVRECEAALAKANEAYAAMKSASAAAKAAKTAYDDALAKAAAATQTADDLASALDAAATPHVDPAAFEAAKVAGEAAAKALEDAKAAEQAGEAASRAAIAATAAEHAAKAAATLDAQVKALTNDAPAALLAASDGIPGLTLDGDAVLLDGVNIESLSGAEQMRFAIEVARRANAKSKILVVDGLERVDLDQMDAFVAEATRDGYQLLATKVDRGEIVIEAIELGSKEEAAW